MLPLWIVLLNPRLVWSPVTSEGPEDEESAPPTDTTLLLPPSATDSTSTGLNVPQDSSKYGTFSSTTSGAATATGAGAVTPERTSSGNGAQPKVVSCIILLSWRLMMNVM